MDVAEVAATGLAGAVALLASALAGMVNSSPSLNTQDATEKIQAALALAIKAGTEGDAATGPPGPTGPAGPEGPAGPAGPAGTGVPPYTIAEAGLSLKVAADGLSTAWSA
jgi:hypothetical protein